MAKKVTHPKFALRACVLTAATLAAGLYGNSATAARHHRKAPAQATHANAAMGLRTGSVLTNVPGKLILSGKSRYPDFEFTKPEEHWPRSVKLLPCLTLQAMEAIHEPHIGFAVSGMLTRYQQALYLLPDADVRLLRTRAKSAVAAPPAPTTEPKTPGKGPDANAEAVLKNLLSHHLSRPVQQLVTIQPMLTARPIPDLPQPIGDVRVPALREGSYIWNRPGRLLFNDPLHEWIFVFQSDGAGLTEPPLIMLPCHLLQRMQTRSAHQGTEIKFRVSGEITQFKGRNYLFTTYVEVAHNLGRF